MTSLSIIIVSFNARADLERCLQSLSAAPPGLPHDITLVDNASTDGGPQAVAARWPGVSVRLQPVNTGFAAANNAGIRATTGELILLLNSDTLVPQGAIDALASRLLAEPAVAAAGPRLIGSDGVAELSFGRMIAPLSELRQKVVAALHDRRHAVVTRWVDHQSRRERYVDWVSGACLLVRREAAVAAGLLDERYFLYTEDVDFCAALRARGGRILFTPVAEVVHVRGRSRSAVPGAMNAAYRRSQIAFYEKHHPRWAPMLKAYLRAKRALPE